MEKWMVYAKKADFAEISFRHGISQILARIIRNRDITGDSEIAGYLNGGIHNLASPWLMKDMNKAVEILIDKINFKKKIRIIGDYDIDGICATHILRVTLKAVGAKTDYKIPDRIKDGYGVNERLIREAVDDGIDTIITCDNGISAFDAVRTAREAGLTVIITDHHSIPVSVKDGVRNSMKIDADAVINPKQEDCQYPFKELCGTAVAYQMIQALWDKLDRSEEEIHHLLEFVGIATIGDVVKLTGENRILAKAGIERLNRTQNIGLIELIKANELAENEIQSYHIGFILGPCLNAGGRLESAEIACDLLWEKNKSKAADLAAKLRELNELRKAMTQEAVKEAEQLIIRQDSTRDHVLVVHLPECHESIAGIVAGRLKEKFNRPSLVLTGKGEVLKGSGRSVDVYDLHMALTECRDILLRFGGHPMAAGLSMENKNLEIFREKLNRECHLTAEKLQKKLWLDMVLPFENVDESLIEELKILEPFGMGNEKPLFAERSLFVDRLRIFGKNDNVLRFDLKNESSVKMAAVAFDNENKYLHYLTERFGSAEIDKAKQGMPNALRISIAYYPKINEFGKQRDVQLVIRNLI